MHQIQPQFFPFININSYPFSHILYLSDFPHVGFFVHFILLTITRSNHAENIIKLINKTQKLFRSVLKKLF